MAEASYTSPRGKESVPVVLRPFGPNDYEALIDWIDSPELLFDWSGSHFTHPLDERQLAGHFAKSSSSPCQRLVFKAVQRHSSEAVGHGELARIMRTDGTAAISRILVPADRRRRGVGTGIVEALARKAFAELGLHRLEVRAFVGNVAAIDFYRRCGFVPEGVLREAARNGDRHESLLVLSMLEDEWRARHESRRL